MDSTKQPPTPVQQVRQAQHRLLKLLVEKLMLEAVKDVHQYCGGSKNARGMPVERR